MTNPIQQIMLPQQLVEVAGAPNVIFGAPGDKPHLCLNCGGSSVMTAFRIDAGPFQAPAGKGSKYLTHEGKTGWWRGELLVGHCPVCQSGTLDSYLRQICGLEGSELKVSLETFRTDGELAGKAQALGIARNFMALNRKPAGFLTFLGDSDTSFGVGKTHLMMGMVNGFRNLGVYSRYTTLADLLAEMNQRFGRDQEIATEEIVRTYSSIRVLAIDELDKVDLLGWNKQRFFRLIDARHRQQGELLTILAANAYHANEALWIYKLDQHGRPAPEAWPTDLNYLESRMLGGVLATLPGPDYRSLQGFARQRQMEGR